MDGGILIVISSPSLDKPTCEHMAWRSTLRIGPHMFNMHLFLLSENNAFQQVLLLQPGSRMKQPMGPRQSLPGAIAVRVQCEQQINLNFGKPVIFESYFLLPHNLANSFN